MERVVSLHTVNGEVETDAEVIGSWAVHGRVLEGGSIAKRGQWRITWAPRGLCGPWTIARKVDALDLARRLRDAGVDAERSTNLRAALRMITDEWMEARGLESFDRPFGKHYIRAPTET